MAADLADLAVVLVDLDVALEQVAEQLERVVEAAVQVEVDHLLVVSARVVVQRGDDGLGALGAALDHADHVADVVGGFLLRRVAGQLADGLLEGADGVDDRVHRVVDLVGDAGDQLTDRRHLLGAHQLGLGPRELVERLGELLVLLREVVGAALHRALEIEVHLLGRPQLVAQRAAHLLEREGQAADLVAVAAGRDRIGQLAAGHGVGALLEPADRAHELRDRDQHDAGARREQHQEEHEQLLQRPHHRLAAAAVVGIEHGDRAEIEIAIVPVHAQARAQPGEAGGADRDPRALGARDVRRRVPRQRRRPHRPTAGGDQGRRLLAVVDVVHDRRRLGVARADLAQRVGHQRRRRRLVARRRHRLHLGLHPGQAEVSLPCDRLGREVLVLHEAPQERHAARQHHDPTEREQHLRAERQGRRHRAHRDAIAGRQVREQRPQRVAVTERLVDRGGERDHQERHHADDRVVELDREVATRDHADHQRDHDPHRERRRGQAVRQRLGQAIHRRRVADLARVAAVACRRREVAHQRAGLPVRDAGPQRPAEGRSAGQVGLDAEVVLERDRHEVVEEGGLHDQRAGRGADRHQHELTEVLVGEGAHRRCHDEHPGADAVEHALEPGTADRGQRRGVEARERRHRERARGRPVLVADQERADGAGDADPQHGATDQRAQRRGDAGAIAAGRQRLGRALAAAVRDHARAHRHQPRGHDRQPRDGRAGRRRDADTQERARSEPAQIEHRPQRVDHQQQLGGGQHHAEHQQVALERHRDGLPAVRRRQPHLAAVANDRHYRSSAPESRATGR